MLLQLNILAYCVISDDKLDVLLTMKRGWIRGGWGVGCNGYPTTRPAPVVKISHQEFKKSPGGYFMAFNPIATRKAKIVNNFGLSGAIGLKPFLLSTDKTLFYERDGPYRTLGMKSFSVRGSTEG